VRRKFAHFLLVLAFLTLSPIPPVTASDSQQVTVMSRNIYLGADVGVAMKLLPNFPAAAQFMWDQVRATDFSKRAPKLAAELAYAKPDVVGIQEATIWYCKKDLWSGKVEVFNFLDQLVAETKKTGIGYSIARDPSSTNTSAFNPGYSIAAIPYLTKVVDPEIFQPLFKQNSASCGFTIGDAILVRDDRKSDVLLVGNSEYKTTYSIIPTLMTIYRGYSWLDLKVAGSRVRIVTTHLESIWDQDKIPNSVLQAEQLIDDLKTTSLPLIVMGDFNADPRDPRSSTEPNPGEQPVVGKACPKPADHQCNAYWLMRGAGFINASPDENDPKNFSWGATALLNGPDSNRIDAAKKMGNDFGFTDRLDYIFTKNVSANISSEMVGNTWPEGRSIWDCKSEKCFATDHAGVVATISLPAVSGATGEFTTLPTHSRFPLGIWHLIGVLAITIVIWRFAHSRNAR
jgi:Endonuclease/Exonuclease/phosphatase family